MEKQHFSILFTIIGFLHLSHGCSIDGINWFVPVTQEIYDTSRGIIYSSPTQNIKAISNVRQGEGLNEGPYIIVTLNDAVLIIETDPAFENYEKIETQTTLRYTITLTCSDSSTRNLVFIINVTDTNNHDPEFLPTSEYEFTIAPPVPPGYVVTTCLNDILVKDIDLTTQSIDFKIEENDLFEISFDPSSQVAKEFKATLKTTNLIRSLAEPVKLTVTATDVDLTEDPPRTAKATVVITADSQFQFPDEPIFSQPFFLATYKSDNDLILQDNIFLRQGYDSLVKFSFESEHSEYFDFVVNQNSISFNMKSPIPIDLYDEKQIYLIVKATREHTSGATTTVIVKLPEDIPLEFENAIYEGTIIDNVLQLIDLKLKQGYEGFNITVDIESEYPFRANVESNVIKISMDSLATDVIENNNFINLQVTASNNRSTAVTVVILEIIKNDYTTPIFEYNFYSGSYSTEIGLTLQQIILTQGFDETVKITLEGEHSKYFQIKQDGPSITLTSSTIPPDIFNQRNIMITVLASKPRTVGAHAAVNVELPSARYLNFEKNIYEGTIENNNLILSNIVLMDGYASDVSFTLEGEFVSYFSIKEQENIVTIEIEKVIPENVVLENDILVLTLNAIGTNAVPTSTSIVLKIIKEDHQTPIFSENSYSLKYENDELSSGNITLVQGFDETVTFELIGDHKEYFGIEPSLDIIKLLLKSPIPEDVIFNNKIIILNIIAHKPRTVGANAAVYITFPQEMIEPTVMNFAQNTYKGLIEGMNLTVDNIVLEPGYTPQTEFILSGEYSEYFTLRNSDNVIKLIPASEKSLEDLEDNNVIILEVKATRERAIPAVTVIVIDIHKTVIINPIFEKAFYTGAYTRGTGLLFDEVISLETGFDSTVEFSLEGEFSKWFTLEQSENSVNLKVNPTNPIPEEILENNSHLFFTVIASKPGAITGQTVIYIDLPKEESDPTILQFEKRQYLGFIENRTLELEIIRLLDADISFVTFNLTGEFSKYFTISKLTDGIKIDHEELPKEVIENNNVILLDVEASEVSAINGHATIVLEIIRNEEQIIIPVFEEAFYTGQYSNKTGLVFSSTIQLAQGFDETVSFDLIEEDAKWFSLIHNGPNDLSLQLKNDGLTEITDRSNLVFTVVANKTNSLPARSAVIISLQDNNDFRVLQFEQKTYLGRIENQILHLENLRLLEDNISSIEFKITGDYASYFTISKSSDSIQINLLELPSEMIEDNDFVILNLEASDLGAISGHTTVVVKIVKDGDTIKKPIFNEIYYTGEYSQESELIFPTSITLVQGYDETVSFELEDDDSQWFSLVQNLPNNLTLKIKNENINEIAGRSHLIFTVAAHKTDSTSARAAIVISLIDNSNIRIVKFEQTSYLGNLENKTLEIEEIGLLGGITSTMEFNIIGDYASYFTISQSSDSIQINLLEPPSEMIEDNDFVILNLEASDLGAISGHTTVVVKIVKDGVTIKKPIFNEIYYTGAYSQESELIFPTSITLVQGYDETVSFELEDDDSQWFSLVQNLPNNLTLKIKNENINEIAGRSHLIFTVAAHKTDSTSARAAIVISLIDNSNIRIVKFEQTSYLGNLENKTLEIEEIGLLGGITSTMEFNIIGDYASYFTISQSSDSIQINLLEPPSEMIEDNDFVILNLEASDLGAISGHTTVVVKIVKDGVTIKKPIFNEIYYTGAYSQESELIFPTSITLVQGYDETVSFELEDDDSQWFSLVQNLPNNLTLKIKNENINEIAGRSHLIFTVAAHKTDSTSARAAIVISLIDNSNIRIVKFEQTSYLGNLENKTLEIEEIGLLGGITSTMEFNIIGDYASYFTISKSSDSIQINLLEPPSEMIEDNDFVILNLEASDLGAISGHTTVVVKVVKDGVTIKKPIFNEIYYTGAYSQESELIFPTSITLVQGYDETVSFELEDDDSQWFSLVQNLPNNLTLKIKNENINEIAGRSHLIFTVAAHKTDSTSARAAIVISLIDNSNIRIVKFEQTSYLGNLENKTLEIEEIGLLGGITSTMEFNIIGDYASYFTISKSSDSIQINLLEPPSEMIEDNDFVILNLEASDLGAISGHTTVVVKIVKDGVTIKKPIFNEIYYTGEYSQESELIFPTSITLVQGYDETVSFELEDDDSQWFSLVQNVPNNLTLKIKNENINEIAGRSHLIFTVAAHKTDSTSARAAIVISLIDNSNVRILKFEQTSYLGNLENNILEIEEISLLGGITSTMEFNITGDYASYFSITKLKDSVQINLIELSTELTDNNDFIILNLKVSEPGAVSGYTTIVVNIVKNEENNTVTPVFSEAYYTGQYSKENGLVFLSVITLIQGYDESVTFTLANDDSKAFSLIKNGLNDFSLILNGTLSEEVNKNYLLFTVIADKPNTNNGQAAIVISLTEPPEQEDVSFDRILYNGKLEKGVLSHDEISLSGFEGTKIKITGEHNALFTSELTNGIVKIKVSGAEFPKNLTYILLELQAASASAILFIKVSYSDPPEKEDVSFDRILYNGKLENGVLSHDEITLSGFEGTNIQITGEHNALFTSELSNGIVKIKVSGAEFPKNLTYILLELQAASANAILLINVNYSDPPENEDIFFDRILYNGKLENGVLSHDEITLSGFEGTNIEITGDHNALFTSELSNGIVKIKVSGAEFPKNLTYILLELQAASANAILLITVSYSENPQPTVSFKSQSYFLWADVQQTGIVGVVEAAADNGEAVIYSLSEHIQSQININSNGEIYLTSAFDKGVYKFNAVATSVQSQVQATAPVLLRVDTLPECSNEAGLSPLIILERLEEEPHLNLVVLNQTEHKDCKFLLRNVFPKDQSWLYVDNDGLHTKAIDREDRSIAFMTLSQIQVELTLDCDSDEVPTFAKRSLGTEDKSDLYSYDDGPNKWVLTDTILFDAKRSLVNLIVTDINDNSPIFLGKGNEPIYVGYPVSELEGTVLPRALAELKATDADIGENAAITYLSREDNLAVSPSTGLVHVRNNAKLENNSRLTIYAIDQNGKGRSGTIDIVVKLLDKNQIIVLTVRDAFLEDEVDVVNELSIAVGYEIKVLRAVVIPNNNEELSRRKRDVDSKSQASLLLYAYGLLDSEPVDINQLTSDINNISIATVNIDRIVSLEDHLEGLEICPAPGRDTGLLAATIVLAVLLFIAIVALAVRFLLKWKTIENYKEFSNRSSSVSQLSSPNLPKIEVVPKLRPDEIKRTERRLQEMLEMPIENAPSSQSGDDVKPKTETLNDTKVNISTPDAPIVIQSIDKLNDKTDDSDDNDEFGEVKKPRKSVVTFNENVEKIIHIEDVPDDNSLEKSTKIYKF